MSKESVVWTVPLITVLMLLMFPRVQRAQANPPKPSKAPEKQDWWLHHEKWDTALGMG